MQNKSRIFFRTTAVLLLALIICFSFTACFKQGADGTESLSSSSETDGKIKASEDINETGIKDNSSVYKYDDEGSIVTMYLTVRRGNNTENTDHSWAEINSYSIFDYQNMGSERYAVEGILKIGNENGPLMGEFGYGTLIPNVTIRIRGNTTSRAAQKSYKIEIKKDKGSWREQRTIALNKHPYDETRILNKLSYDLMKTIPGMVSARTQFVRLFVKDETGNDALDTKYEDYGLFTQVEQFNGAFLKNHGLDENAQFYKAEMFEFLRYQDAIKLKTDPDYNINNFQKILEIKGNDNHTKLINMLDDVNDYSKDIEEVFEYYFDSENYFKWMACNILTGNIDTINRNFYLYSPQNSHTWYFIPWDNDGSFSRTVAEFKGFKKDYGHEIGFSNYWGCILHERVLSNKKYRDMLDKAIEEMRTYLTKEKINKLINTYKESVEGYIYSMPDMLHTDLEKNRYSELLSKLPDEIDYNYALYKESIKRPMPFYIDKPTFDGDKIKYTWGVAFDLDGEDIKYKVEVSKDLAFTQIIATYSDVIIPSVTTDKLATGQYFIRVSAQNESGFTQYSMDYYISEITKNYGVYVFYVLPDGSIES